MVIETNASRKEETETERSVVSNKVATTEKAEANPEREDSFASKTMEGEGEGDGSSDNADVEIISSIASRSSPNKSSTKSPMKSLLKSPSKSPSKPLPSEAPLTPPSSLSSVTPKRKKSASSSSASPLPAVSPLPVTSPLKIQVTLGLLAKPAPLSDQENIEIIESGPPVDEDVVLGDGAGVGAGKNNAASRRKRKSATSSSLTTTTTSTLSFASQKPSKSSSPSKSSRALQLASPSQDSSGSTSATSATSATPNIASPSKHSIRLTLHTESESDSVVASGSTTSSKKSFSSPSKSTSSNVKSAEVRTLSAPVSSGEDDCVVEPQSLANTSSSVVEPPQSLPSSEGPKNLSVVTPPRGGVASAWGEAASATSPLKVAESTPTTPPGRKSSPSKEPHSDAHQPQQQQPHRPRYRSRPSAIASAIASAGKSGDSAATSLTKLELHCRVQLVPADLEAARNSIVILGNNNNNDSKSFFGDKLKGKKNKSDATSSSSASNKSSTKLPTTKTKRGTKTSTKTSSVEAAVSSSDDYDDDEDESSDSSISSGDEDEEVVGPRKRQPSKRNKRPLRTKKMAESEEEEPEVESEEEVEDAPQTLGISKRASFLQEIKNVSKTSKKTKLPPPVVKAKAINNKSAKGKDKEAPVAGKWRQKRRVIEGNDDDDDWKIEEVVEEDKRPLKNMPKARQRATTPLSKRMGLRRSMSRSPSPMIEPSTKESRTPLALKVSNKQPSSDVKKAADKSRAEIIKKNISSAQKSQVWLEMQTIELP